MTTYVRPLARTLSRPSSAPLKISLTRKEDLGNIRLRSRP